MQAITSLPTSQKVDWRFLAKQNEADRQSPNYLSLYEETCQMFAGSPASTPENLPSIEECVQLALEEQRLCAASQDRPEACLSGRVQVPDE